MGYDVERQFMKPRSGLHIHTFGPHGDLIDENGQFENGPFAAAYSLESGGWVLVRPDGYVGAISTAAQAKALNPYLETVL